MYQERLKSEIVSKLVDAITLPISICVEVSYQNTVFLIENKLVCVYNDAGDLVHSKLESAKITCLLKGKEVYYEMESNRVHNLLGLDVVALAKTKARLSIPKRVEDNFSQK